jgi:hypothetical protein
LSYRRGRQTCDKDPDKLTLALCLSREIDGFPWTWINAMLSEKSVESQPGGSTAEGSEAAEGSEPPEEREATEAG